MNKLNPADISTINSETAMTVRAEMSAHHVL